MIYGRRMGFDDLARHMASRDGKKVKDGQPGDVNTFIAENEEHDRRLQRKRDLILGPVMVVGGAVLLTFIGLYLIDGLLWLLLGDFASAAFHAFALVFMVRGFLAFRQLATVNSENVVDQAGVDQANDDADDTEEWLKSVGQRDA